MITYGGKERVENLRARWKEKLVSRVPGYYEWWATEEDFQKLLDALDVDPAKHAAYKSMAKDVGRGQHCYRIYVGITMKSLRVRLKSHILGKHTERNVREKRLSTLRQSIAALFAQNMNNEDVVNKFIDNLVVEWHYCMPDADTPSVNAEIKKIETTALGENGKFYILNIQENKNRNAQSIKKTLKKKRDCAFCAAMKEMQKG